MSFFIIHIFIISLQHYILNQIEVQFLYLVFDITYVIFSWSINYKLFEVKFMADNLLGNATTLINWLALMILPYVSAYGVTHSQLTALLGAILGISFAIINSTYPNTFAFLGNNEEQIDVSEDGC